MIKKIFEGFITLVIIFLISFLIFVAINSDFGIHPILSGSMEPELKVGGLIFIATKPIDEIVVGDVILFDNNEKGRTLVHRVVNIVEKEGRIWFETKGDANEHPDEKLITAKHKKIGKVVFHIPFLGFIAFFIKKNIILIGTVIALFIVFWAVMEIRGLRKEKKDLEDSDSE